MPVSPLMNVRPLGFPWETADPFLFCVYHQDAYPAGTEEMGPPAAALAGRPLGNDFIGRDGWRMYHGEAIPGFPPHPHRGFETVTIVRSGFIDHTDSLGASARFGAGDVQWLTAGRGIVHAEMFPLLHRDSPNPLELFQIWLNLASVDKHGDPYFAMFWDHQVPRIAAGGSGRTEVVVVAGALEGATPPAPPPRSWAARPENGVAIWTVQMAPGAQWTMPAGPVDARRTLYVFAGSAAIGGQTVAAPRAAELQPGLPVLLETGVQGADLLLLQGRPIGEPVAQRGPFVMNTTAELQQTFREYRETGFGGWPWPSEMPVHPRGEGRFAVYPDGRIERP